MNKTGKARLLIIFLLFGVISFVLVFIWFAHGNILGGGEAGASFYRLEKMLGDSFWAWRSRALGGASGLAAASVPYFAFFVFFQKLNLPTFFLQAMFFFILAISTLSSMYLFTREIFPKENKLTWLLASFFYLFNPYSLMNIWNRFLPNTMLFYAILPFTLWLFIRGLRLKKYSSTITMTLLTAVASYAFGAPAQTITFWFIILAVFLFYLFFIKKSSFAIKYFFVTLFSWLLFNFWWLSQQLVFRIFSYEIVSGSFFTTIGNQQTLDALSNSLGKIRNLFLLKHGTFFTESLEHPFRWPLFYSNFLTLFVQWSVLLLTLLFSLKKRKQIWVSFLLFLFVFGIFVSKGNAPPLGEIFNFVFRRYPVFQFFRNPFEKFGLILPLSLSPLFGLGIAEIVKILGNYKRWWGKAVVIASFAYLLIFMGFPLWTGLVFTSGNPPANDISVGYQVQPPGYYKEADEWLGSQEGIFRFITFPQGGEGIFYNWPKGYVGIEQSAILFKTSNISYNTTIPYYNSLVKKLEKVFLERDDFYKVAGALNAKYILLRPDINFKLSGIRDPETISNTLSTLEDNLNSKISFAKQIDLLRFYEISEDSFLPKVYPADKTIISNKVGDIEDFYTGFGKLGDILVTPDWGNQNIDSFNKSKLFHSDSNFVLSGDNYLPSSNDPSILPYVARVSTNRLHPLVLLKEKIEIAILPNVKGRTEHQILLLGKRLVEARLAQDIGDFSAISKSLELYQANLRTVIERINELPPNIAAGEKIWKESFITEAFGTHVKLLEEIETKSDIESSYYQDILETQKLLVTTLKEERLIPIYKPIKTTDFSLENRHIFQFNLAEKVTGEVIFPFKELESNFNIVGSITLQVDNEIEKRMLRQSGDGYLSLGEYTFEPGIHEIGFNLAEARNNIAKEYRGEFTLTTLHDRKELSLSIENFDPYSVYDISFDYYIRSGRGPRVTFRQNTDPVRSGRPFSVFDKYLSADNYWFDYKNFSQRVTPSLHADSGEIIITVEPWNDCEELLSFDPERCSDINLKRTFDRETEVVIKELRVARVFPTSTVLRQVSIGEVTRDLPEVEFRKVNQSKYSVTVKEASEPYILVFSELFDPGWKVYFQDNIPVERKGKLWETYGVKSLPEKNHLLVNVYANGWLVEKTGNYEIVLEYWPQRILFTGYLISGTSAFLVTFYFTVVKLWKGRRKNYV